jgi:uncharacterized protein
MKKLKRLFLLAIGLLTTCTLVSIVALSALFYNGLTQVTPECKSHSGNNHDFTPALFTKEGIDTTAYQMPTYEEVRFPSRDPQITLSAFYIPAENAQAPAVIIVHGDEDCKNMPTSLLPAGMLHRGGFNVLAIDLRNMGNSDIDNGRMAAGTKEYKDVLSAWDWLISIKHIPPEKIGVFGYSLGGASALIAMGKEPRVAAVWADSSFADVKILMDKLLEPSGLKPLIPVGLFVGRIISGDDIGAVQPIDVIPTIIDRPIYVVHGTADTIVPIEQAHMLIDALQTADGSFQFWITDGSEHVGSMFDYTEEYEKRLVRFFTESLTITNNR